MCVLPSGTCAPGRGIEAIDAVVWERYREARNGILYTVLGDDWRPNLTSASEAPRALEATPVCTALYLDSLLLRKDTRAREIYRGLVRLARASGIPGLLARGVFPDGKRAYVDPSVLDYAAFHWALWRYFASGMATPKEKQEITELVTASLTRLEEDRFIICDAEGEPTSFHELAFPGPMQAEHLLAMLLAGYNITGDSHWLRVYERRLPQRINLLRHYGTSAIPLASTCPQNAWTMHRALLSLTTLAELETDSERRAAFQQGIRHAVAVAAVQAAEFRQYLEWRQKAPEAARLVREPVAHPIMIPLFSAHEVIRYWHNKGPFPEFETSPEHRKVWYSAESFAAVALAGDAAQAQEAAMLGRELVESIDFSEFRDVRPLVAALCGHWRSRARGLPGGQP